ncbi:MAG TPA: hypothetical protein VGI03_06655 [Verrucomicrobiae bacterium]|jgi:hypothetical protein
MSYTIIGGDGKEYGLISESDIRKWIAENRLNAQTMAKAESDAAFRPLSAFPEFADAFAPPPLMPGAPPAFGSPDVGSSNAKALQMVKAPAIALIVTAILSLLLSLWSLVRTIFFPPNMDQFNTALQQMNNPQMQQILQKWVGLFTGPLGIIDVLFGIAVSILIWFAAARMMALRTYELAVAGAVLAMIPCLSPCCCIGLPIGIWALIVLRNNEVKTHFH